MNYQVIESKVWRHKSGRTASIYGALPWHNEKERPDWEFHVQGWTVYNPLTNEVGACRPPFATREAAQDWADNAGPCSSIGIGD